MELYPVKSCPEDADSWLAAGVKLKCPNDTLGRNLYQCAPNEDKTNLVEFCLKGSIGRHEEGNFSTCPFFQNSQLLPWISRWTFLTKLCVLSVVLSFHNGDIQCMETSIHIHTVYFVIIVMFTLVERSDGDSRLGSSV